MSWGAFEQGRTIGARGTEEGTILLDEVHELGARITLEEGCRKIPFAITCGVAMLMVHTVYASSRTEADSLLVSMKSDIERLMTLEHPEAESAASEFVKRYP
jgi:hypothetical protein